jgi:hypothetical protein
MDVSKKKGVVAERVKAAIAELPATPAPSNVVKLNRGMDLLERIRANQVETQRILRSE